MQKLKITETPKLGIINTQYHKIFAKKNLNALDLLRLYEDLIIFLFNYGLGYCREGSNKTTWREILQEERDSESKCSNYL